MQRHNVLMRKSLQNVRLAQRRDGEALALGGVVRLDALQGPRVPRVFFRRLKHLRGASRSLDSVRTASNSKKRPPTTSSPGNDARRWREGTAAPRDAEIVPLIINVVPLPELVARRENEDHALAVSPVLDAVL